MKKNYKGLAVFMLTALAALSVTGCGVQQGTAQKSAELSKPAVAYMIGRTANAKPADSSAPIVRDTMVDAAENYGYAFAVRVDGEPELVLSEDLDIDEQFKSASKERLLRDARNKATNLLSVIDNVYALVPEVDFLEGLRCAASSLSSLDETYTSRTIICCGTGLSTTGYLDFQNNLLCAEPEVIVEMLKEREALPDLTGITVYWLGMGQVETPQEKLTPKQAKNLEAIWSEIVEASGGEFVPNEYISVAAERDLEQVLPSVSTINIPKEKPLVFKPEDLETKAAEESVFEEPVMLGEDQVEFVGDEATYLHPEEAINTIRPIAEYLENHETIRLLLIGSTAGDISNEAAIRLSLERAEAVKNTLIEFNIDADRITALGMGSDDPWHIKNAGYEGPAASSNRKVVLIDAQTELAKEIMSNK